VPASAIKRSLADERGLTLVELLVTILLLGMVLTAVLAVLDTSARVAPRDAERANAIGEAQAGLDRMVRELRQAYRIVGWTPSSVQFRVNVLRDSAGTATPEYANLTVEYACGGDPGRCLRREAPAGQPLPATGTVAIDRVLNGGSQSPARSVFDFDQTPDRSEGAATGALPTYVTVRIEVPASGERGAGGHQHTVVLDDGFHVRNVGRPN